MTCREVREIARTLGFHVPELEEVLALTRGKIGLDIELKEEGYEREIIRLVGQTLAEGDFIVSSFHAGCLARVKQCRCRGENRFDLQGCRGPDDGHPGRGYGLAAPGPEPGRRRAAGTHEPVRKENRRLDRERHKTDETASGG